jgi:hypothetical protein
VHTVHPRAVAESFLGRHRFVVLFGTLLAFYTVVPILHHLRDVLHPVVVPLGEAVLLVGLLTGAVLSVARSRTTTVVIALLGLPVMTLWVAELVGGIDALKVAAFLLGVAFFGFTIWIILAFTFATRRVTFNTVCASLCVYLLIALVWALLYSVVDVVNPDSFTWTVSNRSSPAFRLGKNDTAVLYFSLATLTTLGYGDIVPTSALSRMLATLEAVIGQLYLAVLVARLVGLHISQSIEEGTKSAGPPTAPTP